ncbi:hypothetical protein DFP93_10698 [Aneurinibacillus soli]|uniref:Uncharacterized protein n=1 Tax=Aneurinibacillus soli TaxID=1500254 RepID=A0A0U4WN95_9BACL|nr:hypothetical protein [Aneurinibacillus soli]PYE61905.1 hypothetical protein DFP93_10698 [Aneurinibacillus soli]BAU29721.1 hypothetical protein CB4_03958 [Aneurinibacillus soli]
MSLFDLTELKELKIDSIIADIQELVKQMITVFMEKKMDCLGERSESFMMLYKMD